MSHKANFNDRRAGAPKSKILLDLRNLEETEREVLCLCSNKATRSKVLQFVSDMRESLIETANIETQTDFDSSESTEENDLVQEILEKFSRLENDEDILYVVQNLFHIQTDHMKVLNIIQAFQTLEQTVQDKFYQFLFTEKSLIEHLAELIQFQENEVQNIFYQLLGEFLNPSLYEASEDNKGIGDKSIEDLMTVNRSDSFEACDERLKVFLEAATAKKYFKSREEAIVQRTKVQLSNVYDSLLKARNSKYVSLNGLKEHIICYISSGRSSIVSDLMSQLGGKGRRKYIDEIIRNSEITGKFEEPKNVSIFVSFDNIQKLMKSYRLTSKEQEKVYAVVVTSILATLPDGYNCNDIQFKASNSPSAWYSSYWYNETSDVFCEKLDSDALKDCINEMSRDEKVLNEHFEDELQTELETVFNDIADDLKDSIDVKLEESPSGE